MTSINFGDYAGVAETHADSLRWFARTWFDPGDIMAVEIVSHDPEDTFSRRTITVPVDELYSPGNAELLLESWTLVDGHRRTLYFQPNPAEKDVTHIQGSTKTRSDVGIRTVHGLYADLDVKDGSFSTQQEILDFLDSLDVRPTAIVDSGSGGIHAYWKLSGQFERTLLKEWWTYLNEKAGSRSIDQTYAAERIYRLPGSIRWPGNGFNKFSTVKLIGGTGATVPADHCSELSKEPYMNYRTKQTEAKAKERSFQKLYSLGSTGTGLSGHLLEAMAKQRVSNLDWSDILTPHGWSFLKENHDGSRQWVRPGSKQKSAVTDYTHNDGQLSEVMSLLSGSEDSGLLDLRENNIPLTKYRVLLRLNYNDDVNALLKDLKERL